MVKLYTPFEKLDMMPSLHYEDCMMMLGSCFADSMGKRLVRAKFRCDVNPYGTIYNPCSIRVALQEILSGKEYSAQDLYFYNECWHSDMHHGDFSKMQQTETLRLINERIRKAHQQISSLKHLFITFGTAWVYEKDGKVVSNCHKRQFVSFDRRRMSVEEIVKDYMILLSDLFNACPQMEVTFTVSPIRHLKDGLHGNQLSKATLLLAIDQLQGAFGKEKVHYFPAYELLMDEWRDYRFYAADLAHLSEVAEQMVWERFTEAVMDRKTRELLTEVDNVMRMLEHRPLHEDTEEYKCFLRQTIEKIDQLTAKCPQLDFVKERARCCMKLGE